MNPSKPVCAMLVVAAFAASAFAETFDRSGILPRLAEASRNGKLTITDYNKGKKIADKAAAAIVANFPGVAKKDKRAAKAKALCQWKSGVKTMLSRMQQLEDITTGMYSDMGTIVTSGLGTIDGQVDGLLAQSTAEMARQQKSTAAMLKLLEVSPEGISEQDARKINNALDAAERQRNLVKIIKARQERMTGMKESILEKMETLKAVVAAVQVRISELQMESYYLESLILEDQGDLAAAETFGQGDGRDPSKMFESGTSRSLDIILSRKGNAGGSQVERLKRRTKTEAI